MSNLRLVVSFVFLSFVFAVPNAFCEQRGAFQSKSNAEVKAERAVFNERIKDLSSDEQTLARKAFREKRQAQLEKQQKRVKKAHPVFYKKYETFRNAQQARSREDRILARHDFWNQMHVEHPEVFTSD